MKRNFLFIPIVLFLLSCSEKKQEADIPNEPAEENMVVLTPEQYKNAGIDTGSLMQKSISSLLKVSGKIDVPPQSLVSVSVPMGGYLKHSNLLPGMHVNKGDVLAVLEDVQYIQLQQDYLTLKAQLELNKNEYNRQKELNESKASSDKVYEQAKANYESQLIAAKAAEEKLRLIGINPNTLTADNISKSIRIYAPISGYVSAVNVNIGKYVNPNDVLFELINPDDIHLALSVFEKDVDKLFIGQKLVAYTNTHPEKRYDCDIILISRNLSEQNAVEVHCHFDRYDKSLLPGMFMNAEIELNAQNATVLPSDAVVRYGNKQYVFISKGNYAFEMIEVATGSEEEAYTAVSIPDQLANQSFVIKGAYNLLMALKNKSED